jgi:hypothetical protein
MEAPSGRVRTYADRCDRQGPLLPVPDDEHDGEDDREDGSPQVKTHPEGVGEEIGQLGADDADEHHTEPTDPGRVFAGPQLNDEGAPTRTAVIAASVTAGRGRR